MLCDVAIYLWPEQYVREITRDFPESDPAMNNLLIKVSYFAKYVSHM